MAYKLGKRSQQKLEGVDERMQSVVRYAISVTKQDFSVICGLRTRKQQEALVAKGASKTMKSKHLDGHAVDLMAYLDGSGDRWELNLYDEIADAMAEGARAIDIPMRWGAAWHIDDIRKWKGASHTYELRNGKDVTKHYSSSMEDAMSYYIDLRRSEDRLPFIDAPHFELVV